MSGLLLTLCVLLGAAVFLWLAREYTRAHPLDLTARLPQVEKYLLPDGMKLSAEKAELFFDEGPVLRVSGLGLRGPDGELGVYVEHAAIQLASAQLLLMSAAPKVIEASGVTLRLVRGVDGISVAGLSLPERKDNDEGVVEWLNGLGWDRVWGRIKTVKVANLNLLVRDDVQHAEWVLERGNAIIARYPDEGERGTLTAVVRRLYGDVKKVGELDNVPVLVSFSHRPKAQGLDIRGRIDRANAQMVTDYFPPQFKDLLQAQGQVEMGTRVMEANRMAQPWVTLRMTDVKVQPPKGYSKPLKFPKLAVTASYVPPIEGVSDSDVLSIIDLQAVTSRGNVFAASGTITNVQTDPVVDMRLASPKGQAQGIFDMFPDELRAFGKALHWLRPNIQQGSYKNLTAHYAGRPGAFPGCGDDCGVLDIDAQIESGTVKFLDGMSPLKAARGTFRWRGQVMDVEVPAGKVGNQATSDVRITLSDIFSVNPTNLRVAGNMKGDTGDLMAELGRLEGTHGKVPQGISGSHDSAFGVLVPMPRGAEATFAGSAVVVTSTLSNVRVSGLAQLKGLDFVTPKAAVTLAADKTLRVVGDGTLGDVPMKADWSMNIAPGMPGMMKLTAIGTVRGSWLMGHVSTTLVSLTGPVGLALNLQENAAGKWLFGVKADGRKANLKIPEANFVKARGDDLLVEAVGSYVPSGTLALSTLNVQGSRLLARGVLTWNPADMAASVVKLPGLRVGETEVDVDFSGGKANVSGKRLDLRGFDIFGDGRPKDPNDPLSTQPDGLLVSLSVNEVLTENGKLDKLAATVKATKGRWDLQNLTALVDGKSRVNIVMSQLKNQPGRRRMAIDVQDLGRTLAVMGIYDNLEHGRMNGEITYDTPEVGGGLLRVDDFELKNPPVLVQLLSMLSLEQLLAGTSSTKFKTATIPVRVDGPTWHLDNASFEGPSMSLRLDGSYNRTAKQLDIDGKMAPGIPLNRLVGKIPLLGTILTGSQDGVVVADFKIKGSTESPQINVRPLSVITPGLLKDFWRGLTGDEKEKPKPNIIEERRK